MARGMAVLLLTLVVGATAGCGKSDADVTAVKARAVYHLQEGNYDLAIKALDSAIAMRPNDGEAFNTRGNAYASKKELDRAIQDYGRAIALDSNSAFAFKNRGTTYAAKDDVDLALKDLDRAIALKPDFAGALNGRGFLYLRLNQYERALQDFDKSLALSPNSAPALRNRANAHFILGHFAEAAADFERSLKFYESEGKPNEPLSETGAYAVVWLHVAKMRLGQNDSAEFVARSARVHPVNWPRHVVSFYTGKVSADQLARDTAAAEEEFRDDQRCGAEFFAGQAAMAKKRWAEARQRFEATKAHCSKRYVEYMVAEAELSRLGVAAK